MSSDGWQPRRLDELGFVGRGKSRHRPRNDPRLYGGPYPFIQTAEIMNADPYIVDHERTYSEAGLVQSKLWSVDTLCITIAGANTARTAILKIEACFPDSVVGFIPDPVRADLHFVKHSLDVMRDRFLAVTRGATQDNLSLEKLLSIPLPTPHIALQRRIGGILSAYDDLIDNCNRRVRTLERTARVAWRLRFPRDAGGERGSKRDSGCIGDLCDAVRETFDESRGSHLPLLDLARIPQRSIAPRETGSSSELTTSRILFRPGDTLFGAIRCYLHKVVAVPFEGVTNTSVLVLRPKRAAFRSIVALAASDPETVRWAETKSTGTKMPVISWDVFQKAWCPMPPIHTAQKFEAEVGPIFDQIGTVALTATNLRRTRQILAQQLLGGGLTLESA